MTQIINIRTDYLLPYSDFSISGLVTYINTYVLPEEIHKNLFIKSHPFNSFLLDVIFLQHREILSYYILNKVSYKVFAVVHTIRKHERLS